MAVLISTQGKVLPIKKQRIKRNLEKVLEDLGCKDRELSVLLTDDGHMARLNELYLGRKGSTNVMAFPMEENPLDGDGSFGVLGDVVVSLDTAMRESEQSGDSFERRVDYLLIHGLLHLLGYDHEHSEREAAEMENEEERLVHLMEEV